MRRTLHAWNSPALSGREMPVARFGHWGKPVVFFPTAGGDYLEAERFLMVRALAPLIRSGRIKLYLCESLSREAWMDADTPAQVRPQLQAAFDRYLSQELLPWVRSDCGGRKAVAAGASIGAYNAFNAGAKHPHAIDLTIGMSGTYVLDRRMHGHWDETYYFNSPTQFLPRLAASPQLDALQRSRFVLAYGTGRWESPHYTHAAAAALQQAGVPHSVEVWGPDADHDWTAWRRMLPLFLESLVAA